MLHIRHLQKELKKQHPKHLSNTTSRLLVKHSAFSALFSASMATVERGKSVQKMVPGNRACSLSSPRRETLRTRNIGGKILLRVGSLVLFQPAYFFRFCRWYRTWNNARVAVAWDTRRTFDISLLLGGSFSSSSKSEGHAATVISRPLCQPVDRTIAHKRLHNGSPEWCTPLVYVSGLLTRPTKLCDCDSCVREAPEWESCEGRAVASLQLVSPPSLCLLCG